MNSLASTLARLLACTMARLLAGYTVYSQPQCSQHLDGVRDSFMRGNWPEFTLKNTAVFSTKGQSNNTFVRGLIHKRKDVVIKEEE